MAEYVFSSCRSQTISRNDACNQIKRQFMKKTKYSNAFTKVKHRHYNPVSSLDDVRVNKSIIFVTTHEQKSIYLQIIPQQSTKNQQVEGYKHLKKTSGHF